MYAYANCGFLGFGITMKVESLEQQIAKQEERLKQLKAQKQAVLAREKKKQSEQQRKEDTRRKILLGSLALKKMEDEEEKAPGLSYFLVRPLASLWTYCSMAGSSCSMHSTSLSWVRQRIRLCPGRETLKYWSPSR